MSTFRLICLVHGETTESAFAVDISDHMVISDLKEKIKIKKQPEFDQFAPDKLALWKVEIPLRAVDDPVLKALRDNPRADIEGVLKGVKLTDPTYEVGEHWQEPPKFHIHVIIEPPPPAKVFKSIVKNGLPPLGGEIGRGSTSSRNIHHEPANIVHSTFTLIDGLEIPELQSLTWMSYERKSHFNYASEADIAKYVSDALDDIIFTMGMSKDISLHAEIGFRDVRPDIWLINCNGSPVGFIEIKKPSNKIMNDPVMAGQVFDYLKLLESFYGIKFQFGIVSTYVHWRFFWLSGTDAEAQQNIITSKLPSADQSQLLKELPGIPCYDDKVKNPLCIKVIQSSGALQTVGKREVHASRIFTLVDKNVILAIVSILYKMVSSPRHKVNVADLSRSYIQMDEISWHWEELPKKLSNIKFNKIPKVDTKNYICLAYLGSGAEGLVWLATSTGGVGCVVKLAKAIKPISAWKNVQNTESQSQDKIEKEEFNKTLNYLKTEAEYWMLLWGLKAQAKIIGGQPALVMPYIKMCIDDELDNNNEIRNAVISAIKQMARKGFRHNDLSRRHVGIYQKEGILHALFVDLSDIKEDKEKDAIAYMIKRLKI